MPLRTSEDSKQACNRSIPDVDCQKSPCIFKNEAGRWLAKGQESGSGDLSMIYRVSQNEFLLKSFAPKAL